MAPLSCSHRRHLPGYRGGRWGEGTKCERARGVSWADTQALCRGCACDYSGVMSLSKVTELYIDNGVFSCVKLYLTRW